jgi:uncharacterized membrane protein YdjX (TVP38/TMEM64 family)
MTADRSSPRAALLAPAALVTLLILVLIYRYDLMNLDAERLADRVRAWGAIGPLALVALLVLQAVVAPLPSPPILMAAGFVYGPWLGFAIGWFGLLLGAGCCFVLARRLGRPFVQLFVRPEHLTAVDAYAARRRGATVLAIVSLRIFMGPLFDAVSYGCGLIRVPFRWFILGTALGEVPKVGSFAYIGSAVGGPPSWLAAWILLGPAIGILGLRVFRSRFVQRTAPDDTTGAATIKRHPQP